MPRPTATIAIPCWQGAAHLEPLLSSLLAQTRDDFALLMVDDASTDGSVETARRVAGDRIRIESNREQLGLAGNWNRCVDLVDTPYFVLAHQDDVYAPDFVETMIDALERHPTAAFAHCRADAVDGDGAPVASPIETFKSSFWVGQGLTAPRRQFELLRRGNYIVCPSVVYRTETFRSVGAFEEGLHALDWQHHARTTFAGHPTVAVDRRLLSYRRHPGSKTSSNVQTLDRYREEARLLRWIDGEGRTRGWIDDHARPSPALRNNLLFDVYVDFCAGNAEAVAARLDFARTEERALAWDWMTRSVASVTALGPVGRLALKSGLGSVLWLARLRARSVRNGGEAVTESAHHIPHRHAEARTTGS